MFMRLNSYGVAFIMVLAFTLSAGPFVSGRAWAKGGKNPHDYSDKEACASCHKSAVPDLKFDTVTICTRCHEGYLGNHPVAKHPIGKRPGINITRLMPLSLDGKMVCYTCHDNHNRSGYPNMLRTDYLKLCSACHRGY